MHCPECGRGFSRNDNLKRHMFNKHKSHESPQTGFTPSCASFQLQHPFTAMVAGMTGSGKTMWVKNLLEHAATVIKPPPQRIVWCYAQWQPAYDQMMQTVQGIEFVRGIPKDLDEDWYFDPGVTNLIVIDDQMSETSNDKRIVNLFTKGSHHRNLSVIFLLQNLFHQGKITRTMSLNTQYLVLFKNPRDKLQVLTLAKQMYPGKTDQFIREYENGVRRPFGYLFVDLKPNTSDECRLRTNVLPNDPAPPQSPTFTRSNDSSGMQTMANYFKRQSYLQPPVLSALQHLNENMQETLSQPSLPDYVKAQEYTQLLQQFLDLQQQVPNFLPSSASRIDTTTQPRTQFAEIPQQQSILSPAKEASVTPLKSKTSKQQYTPSPQPQLMTPSTSKATAFSPLTPRTPKTSLTFHGLETPPLSSKKPTWLSYEHSDKEKDKGPLLESMQKVPGLEAPAPSSQKQKWFSYEHSDAKKDKGPLLESMQKVPRRSKRPRAEVKMSPSWETY